jgi:hypothetical protein
MQNIRRYREMGSLCRQQAAYHPDQRWKFFAEALHWEHLAEVEMSSHFDACKKAMIARDGISLPSHEIRLCYFVQVSALQ